MHALLGEAESPSQAEVSRVDVKQAGDRQAYERCWDAGLPSNDPGWGQS